MGDKNLLKQILKEQQKTNELLQTIVSSEEQNKDIHYSDQFQRQMKNAILFYKAKNENHYISEVIVNESSPLLNIKSESREVVEKEYPIAKNNLFALVDGIEIKLTSLIDR